MAAMQSYLATTDERGLQLHLYGAGTVHTRIGRTVVGVTTVTDYPWHGRIRMTVTSDRLREWTLALRVPQWCASVALTIDGTPVGAPVRDGYVRLTRTWAATTTVDLELDMPARRVVAHPYVDAARGCVTLARGPLVYCVEQADLPVGVALADVRLDASADVRPSTVGDLPDGVVALTAGGLVRPPSSAMLYTEPGAGSPARPIELTAIPYYLWGNRDEGPMRVWIPTDRTT
jgi:DUF1680 family protein